MPSNTKKGVSGTKATQGLKIIGDGKYPLVPLFSIQLAERPEEGMESSKLFYNPRSIESFDSEAMNNLRESIQQDGLQQPPIVRVVTADGKKTGKITLIQLIAGERRYRSIYKLYEDDAECYDEDSGKMVAASTLYENIPCKVLYNIDDQTALRIAFKENNEHKSLSISEEIALVERLTVMGMKQEEISDLLGTNVTWVSQTANFRSELPEGAFDKLMDGKLSRHVAVQILSFRPSDRERLYNEAVAAEEEEREKALADCQSEIEMAEDEEDIALSNQDKAARKNDVAAGKKAKKNVNAATKKIQKAKEKKGKIAENSGVIKQGHISKGSQKAGVAPKKAKMLPRSAIEQFYVDLLTAWLRTEKADPHLGCIVPVDVIKVMRMTTLAILSGQHDPMAVIRNYMVEEGEWTIPAGMTIPTSEEYDFEEVDDEEYVR